LPHVYQSASSLTLTPSQIAGFVIAALCRASPALRLSSAQNRVKWAVLGQPAAIVSAADSFRWRETATLGRIGKIGACD
jgi:hypothetical protein